MGKKITLTVYKVPPTAPDLTGVVRISPEAEIAVREIQRQSGLSAKHIISEIIIQSLDNVEIIEK